MIDITVLEDRLHLVPGYTVTTQDDEDIKTILWGRGLCLCCGQETSWGNKDRYAAELEVAFSFPRLGSTSSGSLMHFLSHGSRATRLFLDLLIAGANK